jgi:lipoate-protein ligase A
LNYYIESRDTDPHKNLALEQFVFDRLDRGNNYFMLWQNHNAIIVGKYQNTQAEVNAAFVKENNIAVVRRLSGGGAVYHDLGNLNFTFITAAEKGIDFSVFCEPIRVALSALGVPVEFSGRNDMTVEGKKFSGNAQYIKEGRVMHHGTILYDSDLTKLSLALNPGEDKIESKGIKSLRSRVTNIRPYMKSDMPISDFWASLKAYMLSAFDMRELNLTQEQNIGVEELKEKIYAQWSWNYGNSPPYTLRKTRRIEGCGKIEVFLDIKREGKIKNITFYGDFFGNKDLSELGSKLIGRHLEYNELNSALSNTDISQYFHNLSDEAFLTLLLS